MLIKNKEYNSVLFVHIPKTAGTSISKLLKDAGLDNWNREWPRHHDPYFYLKENNTIDDTVFSFSVVRNPYTRTYSCFKQFNKANQTNLCFEEYLNNILQKVISPISPLLHLSQSFYIVEESELQTNKLYKFENIKEFESDFGWKLGNYNVGNYNHESYINDYTDEAIDMVRDIYETDFQFFGYSTEFKRELATK